MSISGLFAFCVGWAGCRSPISSAEIAPSPRGEFCDVSSFSEVEPSTTLPRLNFPRESFELRIRSKSEIELALPDRGVLSGAKRGESWIFIESQTVDEDSCFRFAKIFVISDTKRVSTCHLCENLPLVILTPFAKVFAFWEKMLLQVSTRTNYPISNQTKNDLLMLLKFRH